jgi:hypothetical protein
MTETERVLKVDARGRVWTPRERREDLLAVRGTANARMVSSGKGRGDGSWPDGSESMLRALETDHYRVRS